jgi:hypothetical protein
VWKLKNTIFWVETPCSLERALRFEGKYRFHPQADVAAYFCLFRSQLNFLLWKRRWWVPTRIVGLSPHHSFISSAVLQPIVWPCRFFSVSYSVWLLGLLPARKHRHPRLEWDSNPRPQRSSGRRQVHDLDRTATVIGCLQTRRRKKPEYLTVNLNF